MHDSKPSQKPPTSPPSACFAALPRQRGISLLESMVAIVVMAIGILGILGVQLRTLADTQTSVRRAQAIRLIEDLGERMKINPNAHANINNYVSGWRTDEPPTAQAAKLCDSDNCSHTELAAYDLSEWRRAVERALPLGNANVFLAQGETVDANRRQLGVMLSWRENERNTSAAYQGGIDATKVLGIDGGGTTTCPADRTCHLQYLAIPARCTPYSADSTVKHFCPGS
ncbi:hypothetical protein AwPolaro_07000 [Polaromonas sp.]|nr:hypothetical protein AwPolaro_07000 [Polaromonas sp.]